MSGQQREEKYHFSQAETLHNTETWVRATNFITPMMGSNWNSAVLICTTEFVLYAIKSLIYKSETIKNHSITDSESVSMTEGL